MSSTDIWKRLAAPFPAAAVSWRAQQVFERDGQYSALALAYIDARDVMGRFDEVLGPEGWQDSYQETPSGRLICSLSVLPIGETNWITKSDGAGSTDVEGDKGAISDAFKRAGVKWGVGRYLYDLGNTYAPCEAVKRGDRLYFKKWAAGAEKIFKDALARVGNQDKGWREPRSIYSTPSTLHAALTEFRGLLEKCSNILELNELTERTDWHEFFRVAGKHCPHYLDGGHPAPPEFVGLRSREQQMRDEFNLQNANHMVDLANT